MEDKMNESLKTLKCLLDDLDEKSFKLFIPSYQRGYRWRPAEVKQLLNDIDEEKLGDHYFLQLLAVREDDESASLRIIDGQQRLTTVLLILDCIDGGSRIRDIAYETRKESSLDNHFMDGASSTINDWFKDKSNAQKHEFVQKLEQCEFLYFPVKGKKEEPDLFSRLNTWKIEATDSELVKCFFLSNDDPTEIEKRAIKWNQIERQLSDNHFWGMFSNHEKDRMGVLLSYAIGASCRQTTQPKNEVLTSNRDLTGNEMLERFPLFEAFKSAEKDGKQRKEDLWGKVEDTISMLQKWFGNRADRHLVGWFFHCEGNTRTKIEVNGKTIQNAIKAAKDLCGDGKWLEDENLYCNNREGIQNYLLLANVAWCSERCGVDYDFYRHALVGRWSIEHVHARNQRNLSEVEFKSLKFKEDDMSALWDAYIKMESKDEANAFLQEKLSEESGYPNEDEDNSFGNLALLPGDANSSLNDKLFRGKQREILSWALQREDTCYWAPPLTVSMFVKEIGCPDDKFRNYWSADDRKAYKDIIKSIVQEFLRKFDGK